MSARAVSIISRGGPGMRGWVGVRASMAVLFHGLCGRWHPFHAGAAIFGRPGTNQSGGGVLPGSGTVLSSE